MEIGKRYKLNKPVANGMGHGFAKGDIVTPVDKDGEVVHGERDPQFIQCYATDKAKCLFIHPDWVEAA